MPAAKDGSGKIRQRHTQSEPNFTRISPCLPYLPAFPCLPGVGVSTHAWELPTLYRAARDVTGKTRKNFFFPSLPTAWSHCGSPTPCPLPRHRAFSPDFTLALLPAPTRISAPEGSDPPRKYRAVQPCSRVCAPCPSPTPRPTLGAHPHLYFLPQGLRPCGPAARSSHIEHSEHSGIFPTGVLSDSQWRRHYYVWP